MTYLEKAKYFQDMQTQGKTMEAFEQYYADDCKVIEIPTGEVRDGKEAQRKAINEWFGMVKEFHGSGVKSITANEEAGTSCCETWFDITFQDGNRRKMEEVGVQQWRGDQIVEERFYYNMPEQPKG